MTTQRKLGIAIVLIAAIVAAIGVVGGFFSITSAVGLAVVGLLIGTGVARGRFSSVPGTKN
jgi:hypothetical protein